MKISKSTTGDYIICFAVFWYCVVSLFLMILMGMNLITEENQTAYRIVMIAIPLIVAIIIGFYRNPGLFLGAYLIAFVIVGFTFIIFPQNMPFVSKEGFRFLLPVCISSALCLMTVRDLNNLYKVLEIVAYIAAFEVFVYLFLFIIGNISLGGYNMQFSFSCLIPMLVLYEKKKILPVICSFIVFFMVIAIGSRGALLPFLIFIVYDMFSSSNKWRWVVLLTIIIAIALFPFLVSFLGSIGVTSRTLVLYESGELMSDSGRGDLQKNIIQLIKENPLGLGIYSDRVYLDGAYCHNIILELLLDFGWLFGVFFIIWVLFSLFSIFKKLSGVDRNYFLIMLLIGIVPYMFSGSYLQAAEPWWIVGISVLYNKRIKQIHCLQHQS